MNKKIIIGLIVIGIAAVVYQSYLSKNRYTYPNGYPQNYEECIQMGGETAKDTKLFSRCEYKSKYYETEG
jgi:hypothetical protein